MTSLQFLVEQFHSLRASPEIKAGAGQAYDRHIKQNLVKPLTKVNPNDLKSSQAGDPLEFLDPSLDTLPYLFSLSAQILSLKGLPKSIPDALKPDGHLFQKLQLFLTQFDPIEVRYAGYEWRRMVEVWAQLAALDLSNQKPEKNLTILAEAILRLDPSAGTFTSLHLLFVRTCMERRAYREARLILDKDIHSLIGPNQTPQSHLNFPCEPHPLSNSYITLNSGISDKVVIQDVQEYYLLGGMAYIALKEWQRSAHFLEHVLVVPTANVANSLMLEAYKKWVLVLLLSDKTVNSNTPELGNSAAVKVVKNASKAYDAICSAFKDADIRKLLAEVYEGHDIWTTDGNLGLVRNVIEHHRQTTIRKMANIYISVPLSEMATKLNMKVEDAMAYLSELTAQGKLGAAMGSVSDDDSTVVLRFMPDGALNRSNEEMLRDLTTQKQKMVVLDEHVKEADRRLGLTREYLETERRNRKKQEQKQAGVVDEDAMEVSMNVGPPSDEDENVMAT